MNLRALIDDTVRRLPDRRMPVTECNFDPASSRNSFASAPLRRGSFLLSERLAHASPCARFRAAAQRAQRSGSALRRAIGCSWTLCGTIAPNSHRHDLFTRVSAGSDSDDVRCDGFHDLLVLGLVLVTVVNVGDADLLVICDAVHGITSESQLGTRKCAAGREV